MTKRDHDSHPRDTKPGPEDEARPGEDEARPGEDEEAPEGMADVEPVRLPIEDVLDLHSFRPDEVASVVGEYLAEAVAAGFEQVRIIHGRGVGVQREIVRAILARAPFVVSFKDAPQGGGGWGATIAVLRTTARPPNRE